MKLKFSLMALLVVPGFLAAQGCQQQQAKPATSSATLDLTTPQSVAPTPVAYTPSPMPTMQTATPDAASMSAPTPMVNATVTPASGNTYTVKPGDTLWKIAAAHYGDGKKWHQIVQANPGLQPSQLKVGQTITLP